MGTPNSRYVSAAWSVIACICALAFTAPNTNAGVIHRYSFSDNGAVKDSAGKVDGSIKGDATVADGKVTFKNEDKNSGDENVAYVEFPQPLLPKTGSVTLMAWFTAKDAGQFSRVIDIGDQEGGQGQAFIYFTPRNADDQSRAAITATDAGSKTFADNDRLDDGKPHMVALVIDGAAKKLHFYVDGKEPQPAQDLNDNTLSAVRQKHAWLGRSAFDSDPGFSGSIDEFRVYDQALSADDVTAAFKAGPDSVAPVSSAPTTQP
jgi:hypothetical protein